MSYEKSKMIEALQLMSERNDIVQDTHGNVSFRTTDGMYIKPSGMPYETITESDLCAVRFEGFGKWTKSTSCHRNPSVDTVHHTMIYQNNPQIQAICHTHSPHVVAHAILQRSISCLCTEQADYFGGIVNCLFYEDLDSWGNITILENEKAVLLGSHGALTFSSDPVSAVKLAIQLENVARKNILAGDLNRQSTSSGLDGVQIKKWHERYNNVYGQR